jgi:hypothetical protein
VEREVRAAAHNPLHAITAALDYAREELDEANTIVDRCTLDLQEWLTGASANYSAYLDAVRTCTAAISDLIGTSSTIAIHNGDIHIQPIGAGPLNLSPPASMPQANSSTALTPAAAAKAIASAAGYLNSPYDKGFCLEFVQSAYQAAGVPMADADSAASYWRQNPNGYSEHPGNTDPPVGALVFWGPSDVDGYSNPYGHVGIYVGTVPGVGTDEVISTGSWGNSSDVHYFSLSGRNRAGYPYLGWLAP